MQLASRNYVIECVVVRKFPYDILLGLEFLKKHRVELNYATNEVIIDKQNIKLVTPNLCGISVKCAKDTTIPPMTETMISVKIESQLTDFMIEPHPMTYENHHVLVCNSINKFEKR